MNLFDHYLTFRGIIKYHLFSKRFQSFSKVQIQNYQYKELKKLLVSAYNDTEYYKTLFDSIGFNPIHDFRDLDDIKNVPILTKELAREKHNQLINKIKFASLYTKRSYDEHDVWSNVLKEDQWRGYRNAIYYSGIYNINLDNSLTFGAEKEFDEMDYEKFGKDYNRDANTISKFFDLQSRITNNLYATVGLRFDEHSRSGTEDSHRASLAYLFDDKLTKFKASYGTSFRYPSLYEQYTAYKDGDPTLAAEEGTSFDVGVEKNFLNHGIKIDLTYFLWCTLFPLLLNLGE